MSEAPHGLGLFFGAFALVWIFCILLGLAFFAFWLWALIEIITKETDNQNMRLIWILVVIFAHGIGGILYLTIRRPQRIKELGS